MKKVIYSLTTLLLLGGGIVACKDEFLERPQYGVTDENALANEKGVDAILIGAYSALDGWTNNWSAGAVWTAAGSNWVFGSIQGGDATKGSDANDQPLPTTSIRWVNGE
jgi:starch-binding outer membrane protein, SusD/RagB family